MKIVFFGTPEYVLPILTELHKSYVTGPGKSPIVTVVTQAPKPVGRKQIKTYSPIDKWGFEHKIPVFYTPLDLVENKIDADLGVLASYGAIIPSEVLKLFPQGILNVHPSLLPKLRGASPIQAAIVLQEKVTGATIIKLDEKLDHGPIVSQFKEDISPQDTGETLRNRLFERSAKVLVELIDPYIQGKIKLKPQDDSQATFTRMIKKEFGVIIPNHLKSALEGKDLEESWEIGFIKNTTVKPTPAALEAFIRAMSPWPMAWTNVYLPDRKRLIIRKAHLEDNKLILDEVQLEGKNPVTWNQFKSAYPKLTF